jgi:uncharacterized damage-inducible protein DinB
LTEVPAVQRAVLHALELAEEDLKRWCGDLSDEEMNARPFGLAPVAFHLRHIARSLDRLLTYAEGQSLTAEQLAALSSELDSGAKHSELFTELDGALKKSATRILAFQVSDLEQARSVGKRRMPTTFAGLLVHVADHSQRHVGQASPPRKLFWRNGQRSPRLSPRAIRLLLVFVERTTAATAD